MSDLATAAPIAIDPDRLERIGEVLSYLSIGEFDPERITISIAHDDEFAQTEGLVNVFAEEYVDARNEAMRLHQEREQLITRQRDAIDDLATPMIDIWDDIITLPLVGIIDTQRSVDMTEKLLSRIADSQTRCVIIDLTGVTMVDTMTADHLVKMIRSAQLLGAYCVVSGIRPRIARTMTQLSVDMSDIPTVRTLKDALKVCFKRLDATVETARQRG